jgi:class 3 adenylate cyclase
MSETRKLAAILVADVVGYSRLAGADEERTLARLRALRNDLIDPTISVHRGRVVKRTGDGAIVEFRSVVDAVRCAVEVQTALKERNSGLAPEKRLEFRVGIHVGDVVEESDGDLMGDGVNIAARLEGVAKPGGICLSEDAWRHAQGKVEASFIDAGERRLKNIASPVRAFLWASEKVVTPRHMPVSWARSIAVALGIGARRQELAGSRLRRMKALIALVILLTFAGSAAWVPFWPAFEQRKPPRPSTKNLEAYDDFLRAENEGYYNLDAKAPASAMAFYRKAIELDPNFADALAGYAMAAVQVLRFNFDYFVSNAVARKRAYDAAGPCPRARPRQ